MLKIILTLIALIGLNKIIFSQFNKVTDSTAFPKIKNINHRLHPFIGLHVSGDAEMFYIGPSFQAGIDYQLAKKIILTSYIHYYSKKINNNGDNGFFENGKFKTTSIALLCQKNLSKKINKNFFIAAGISYQYLQDNFIASYNFNYIGQNRKTVLPAIRLGYFFPAGANRISIEINGTGPYSYADGNRGTITEMITQLSLGLRFILK